MVLDYAQLHAYQTLHELLYDSIFNYSLHTLKQEWRVNIFRAFMLSFGVQRYAV
mgnify:CR=1 FL=1